MLGDEGYGVSTRHKAEIFEAVDRQVREWTIVTLAKEGVQGDRQDPCSPRFPLSREMTDKAHHRRLDTPAGAEEANRPPVLPVLSG
jgi:hypothetical protein